MIFWSTRDSINNDTPSVTAIIETVLAVLVYWVGRNPPRDVSAPAHQRCRGASCPSTLGSISETRRGLV
jgi:hypothetical protein